MNQERGQSPHRRSDLAVATQGQTVTLRAWNNPAEMTSDEARELASRILEAAARADSEDPEERDWKRQPMQYLRLAAEALPEDGGKVDGEPETVLVHCWIKDQTRRNAQHVAEGWIAESGWAVIEGFDQRAVSRTDFEDTDFLRYYEQALTDEEVFVFEHDREDGEPGAGENSR